MKRTNHSNDPRPSISGDPDRGVTILEYADVKKEQTMTDYTSGPEMLTIAYSVIAVIAFGALIYKERHQVGVDPTILPLGLLVSALWPISALALLILWFSTALAKFFIKVEK